MSELKPVNIAILALGGEGGDVLAAWLADAAERLGDGTLRVTPPRGDRGCRCGVASRGGVDTRTAVAALAALGLRLLRSPSSPGPDGWRAR